MKIWLSKNSEIPVREQLITQITLGIAGGDLAVGEKLPSTRELARRFKVHANTISFAYRKLGEDGVIEFKKGSGFYVCDPKQYNAESKIRLDTLVDEFFETAQFHGFTNQEIRLHLEKRFSLGKDELIIVVESDIHFRRILIEEIKQVVNLPVKGVSFENLIESLHTKNAIFAAMSENQVEIENLLPADSKCLFLKARSVSDSITGETRPAQNDLIAVVSDWEKFLYWSKTILSAANIEDDSILLRSTAENCRERGLKNAALIICDVLTAKRFPNDDRVRIFNIIADLSLHRLKECNFNDINESV